MKERLEKDYRRKVLLLAIDVQNDFMDGGALGVPGAKEDTARIVTFIEEHSEDITQIMVSLDTHKPQQIFHPCWWEDGQGREPDPFTIITARDVKEGKWKPKYYEIASVRYVQMLERNSKKQLCIWPYHCLQGTYGAALEEQFAKKAYQHSVEREYELQTIVKGLEPLSEMYGIIQPEYSEKNLIQTEVINTLKLYDEIVIVGEAASHCVLESVAQIAEHLRPEINSPQLTVLEDCMSCIPSFEEDTDNSFRALQERGEIEILTSNQWKGRNVIMKER
ncbi:isochorismatase family protein [Salirhabdus salicampi]|uniref:isochorismatase family protein n=1 Tax=Salirhabdus salicampi TaxID=476102 RepID=UPI0020C3D48A|nr:isochorismatase family protein [Salirhabdus salicampi]MCP8618101.1 isochorismatase family protein [Salirhabdus salicampi]